MVKVKMLRPIGGYEEGDTRDLSAADAKRLEARGAVQIVDGKKADKRATANKSEGRSKADKAEGGSKATKSEARATTTRTSGTGNRGTEVRGTISTAPGGTGGAAAGAGGGE